MEDELNLHQKIAKASIEVGAFVADKRNNDQGYSYISADQVLARGGDALSKQGVAVVPSIVASNVQFVDRANGKQRIDASVEFQMAVSDGKTEAVSRWIGYGSDYATPDKAIYKAITSGHKYFLMKLLHIGMGNEDSEHENLEQTEATKSRVGAAEEVGGVERVQGAVIKVGGDKGEYDPMSPEIVEGVAKALGIKDGEAAKKMAFLFAKGEKTTLANAIEKAKG